MSNEAITWAFSLKVGRSSAKFVLIAMANCANANSSGDLVCWPSMKYLTEATDQDRKTVLENIKRLKEEGFIVDTNLRKGVTGSVHVYRLCSTENGTAKLDQCDDDAPTIKPRSSPENGIAEPIEAVPKTDISSPVFPDKQSRFSHEAVPKTDISSPENGTRNPKETKEEPKGNPKETVAAKKRAPQKTPLPDGFCISERVRNWAEEKGHQHLDRHFENFVGSCRARGYTYVDWDDAFMNAVRNDWAKVGQLARASPGASKLGTAGQATAMAAQKWLEESNAER